MIAKGLLFLFAVFTLPSLAQNGNYSLSHFVPAQESSDYLSFDLTQDERGIVYIAGKEGIEEFDGRSWRLIPTPGVSYTLAKANNRLAVGGLDGYGLLVNDPEHGWGYKSLSKDATAKGIFASVAIKDILYFINDDHVYVVDAASGETTLAIKAPDQVELSGIFEIAGSVLIGTTEKGLFKVDNGKLIPAGLSIGDGQLLFVEKLNETNNYLIGTAANQLFIYRDNKSLSEIKVKDQAYLNTHIVSDGVWLNQQIVAIGTLRGGVAFINTETGATEEIIDYNTGLPDNEVFALLCDKRQGIWVAHNYGYTRIATSVPFRTFSHYKGLSGNLLAVQSINGILYAGTSVGLYFLAQEEIYDEEVYYVTKKVSASKAPVEENPAVVQTAPEERQRAKRGLFGFLRKEKKKNEGADQARVPTTTPQTTKASGLSKNPSREKRTRKVFRTFDYAYKRVNGIEGKVTQLWDWNGKLLAAGPSGLYEINGDQSKVISDEPIRSFTITKDARTLVAATYDDEVKTFSSDGTSWDQIALLDTLHTFVSFLFEDKQQNIWLCGLNAIYKAEISEGELVDIVKIPFSNPTMAETFGMAAGSDVFVMIAGTILRFDRSKEKFIPYDSLPATGKSLVSGNLFWYFDGHNWGSLDEKIKQKFKLEWLNLFPELRFVSPDDKNENLWVITASNELYRFSANAIPAEAFQFPLFLKDVRNPQTKLTFTPQKVVLSQELGAVTFEFIQPEYSGLQTTEYRYWVQGLQTDWSEWSSLNNEISFPFLPVGSYKVMIQSKNLFGQVSDTTPVNFVVEPPYWKQAWFYGAEVAFFSMLVVLSIRLSALNERYRVISRLLSLLTVIMLIQLIQSAAYSMINIRSTPVVDFFIQVSIALLVLPLEAILRKFMLKASDGGFRLSKIVGRS